MALLEDNSRDWRVGVLFSQTGVTSAIEQTQLNATLLAIDSLLFSFPCEMSQVHKYILLYILHLLYTLS